MKMQKVALLLWRAIARDVNFSKAQLKDIIFDRERRSNRGLKNCLVVVVVLVQFQYLLN